MMSPGCGISVKQYLAGCLAVLLATSALAFEPLSHRKPPPVLSASGTVQVAFTPGHDAGELIASAIDGAHTQVLVQAFSFTHRKIADALIGARKRGVDVKVIADREQTEKIPTSLIARMVSQGVPVFTDSNHSSAHNKVMLIDAGSPGAALITGSFNFTHAAQYKNAENVLVMRGNPALVALYLENWLDHFKHARPYR